MAYNYSDNEEIFEPLNLQRFQLPSGSLKGKEIFVYYAFYDTSTLDKEEIFVALDEETILPLEWAEIKIIHGSSWAIVKLHRLPRSYEYDINVCIVGPLFWYNDWPRVFLILEKWRVNKVRKVLLHVHSMSQDTKRVLDYYIKKGLLEIRPYPMMPFTNEFDPNNHIFYTAQHLVTFMCSVWNVSETLLKVVERMDEEDLGSFTLKHNALGFLHGMIPNPWNFREFLKFDFLKSAIPYKVDVNGKYIMKTGKARVPWIHGMKKYFGKSNDVQISTDDILLLHLRNSYNDIKKKQNLFPEDQIFQNLNTTELSITLREIFGDEEPSFRPSLTDPILHECMKSALSDTPGEDCLKTTGNGCFDVLKDLDDWLFAVPTEGSHYIPI
ncbi:unnamed protein product, partial [Mesorhabditis belari]|uniref:Glycosyltransferase family 92 protein n=1 Tax=Mesorhabditis belari TaxID=2138241 RepID=A0AAF3FIQ9_9BILA